MNENSEISRLNFREDSILIFNIWQNIMENIFNGTKLILLIYFFFQETFGLNNSFLS